MKEKLKYYLTRLTQLRLAWVRLTDKDARRIYREGPFCEDRDRKCKCDSTI